MPFDGRNFVVSPAKQRDLAILRTARDALARPGNWIQGTLHYDGARCAVGWLIAAAGEGPVKASYNPLIAKLLQPALPRGYRSNSPTFGVGRFNDVPWRRKRRIVQLFDDAIRLREKRP